MIKNNETNKQDKTNKENDKITNNKIQNDKIEQLKNKHNLKMELMKLKGNHKKEKTIIKNDIELDKFKAEKDQVTVKEEIRQLKIYSQKDENTISSGKKLLLWGLIGTLTSGFLTISGLWDFFSSSQLKLVCFIAAILMVQFSVYILSKQITEIRQNYKKHIVKVNTLRFFLFIISVCGNYIFFTSGMETSVIGKIIIFLLCICIDLISIYCVSIGNDFKTLSKSLSINDDIIGISNLFKKIRSMFVQGKNTEKNTDKKSSRGHLKVLSFVQDKQEDQEISNNLNKNIGSLNKNYCKSDQGKRAMQELSNSNVLNDKKRTDFVQDKNTEIVKSAILSYKDNDICPSVSALCSLTGLTKNEISKAKKTLENQHIIETQDRITYVK